MDDLTSLTTQHPQATRTDTERARRKAAIDYARGSVRLEGFVVSEAVEEMNRRYIDGEIDRAALTASILAYHAR